MICILVKFEMQCWFVYELNFRGLSEWVDCYFLFCLYSIYKIIVKFSVCL